MNNIDPFWLEDKPTEEQLLEILIEENRKIMLDFYKEDKDKIYELKELKYKPVNNTYKDGLEDLIIQEKIIEDIKKHNRKI